MTADSRTHGHVGVYDCSFCLARLAVQHSGLPDPSSTMAAPDAKCAMRGVSKSTEGGRFHGKKFQCKPCQNLSQLVRRHLGSDQFREEVTQEERQNFFRRSQLETTDSYQWNVVRANLAKTLTRSRIEEEICRTTAEELPLSVWLSLRKPRCAAAHAARTRRLARSTPCRCALWWARAFNVKWRKRSWRRSMPCAKNRTRSASAMTRLTTWMYRSPSAGAPCSTRRERPGPAANRGGGGQGRRQSGRHGQAP